MLRILFHSLLTISLILVSTAAYGLEKPGEELKEVGLTTERGRKITRELTFVDAHGRKAPLSSFLLKHKPNIIIPAYYDCPRLCGLLLEGVRGLIDQDLGLKLGKDYNIVTVSFDPSDTSEQALREHQRFTEGWSEKKLGNPKKWHFLTGKEGQINDLMMELGFHYQEDKGEFAHTAAIFALTPQGEISQYFADVRFSAKDVRLALVEAGRGSIGNIIDQALLFCFRFDPTKGKYTWAAFNMMRAGGGLTLCFLLGLFFWLRKKERNKEF